MYKQCLEANVVCWCRCRFGGVCSSCMPEVTLSSKSFEEIQYCENIKRKEMNGIINDSLITQTCKLPNQDVHQNPKPLEHHWYRCSLASMGATCLGLDISIPE